MHPRVGWGEGLFMHAHRRHALFHTLVPNTPMTSKINILNMLGICCHLDKDTLLVMILYFFLSIFLCYVLLLALYGCVRGMSPPIYARA